MPSIVNVFSLATVNEQSVEKIVFKKFFNQFYPSFSTDYKKKTQPVISIPAGKALDSLLLSC